MLLGEKRKRHSCAMQSVLCTHQLLKVSDGAGISFTRRLSLEALHHKCMKCQKSFYLHCINKLLVYLKFSVLCFLLVLVKPTFPHLTWNAAMLQTEPELSFSSLCPPLLGSSWSITPPLRCLLSLLPVFCGQPLEALKYMHRLVSKVLLCCWTHTHTRHPGDDAGSKRDFGNPLV